MGKGFLKIQLYEGDNKVQGKPMTVLIKENGQTLSTLLTDENGATQMISLDTPPLVDIEGLDPSMDLFSTVDVEVPRANGYKPVAVYGVQVFDNLTSILNVQMESDIDGTGDEIVIVIPPERGIHADRNINTADYNPLPQQRPQGNTQTAFAQSDSSGTGHLLIQLYEGDFTLHGESMTVLVKQNGEIIHTLQTDENGTTPTIAIAAPDLTNETGLDPRMEYYSTVDVVVPAAKGYAQVDVHGVQIFDGITSELDVHMEPDVDDGNDHIDIDVPPEHGVDEDRNPDETVTVDYTKLAPIPPRGDVVEVFNPIPIDPEAYEQTFRPSSDPVPSSIPFANEVVIPEFITVHLGSPNVNARNVRVRFRDYLVNVACSEIYPFWHPNAIIANVHAQCSFALNRLFTHWYRSRNRNFDITNNTQFDQKFIYGREIFQNVARIVDGIFNQFLRRPGRLEPYLSSYCNGTTSTCPGMSQHGSQALALRGFTPLQILRHYYPSDINIVQSTNFGPRNPGAYPGAPLREGSTGEDVLRLQLYLNRISGNWWIPAIQNPNGVFGPDTRATVVAFQRLFNLNPDGVVGPLTWYEITRVYVAARRMAELNSEGQRYSIGNNPPAVTLRLNARGEAVVELQFLLNFIGTFYNDIPFVVEDNVFRDSTRVSVIAFQRHFGLNPDGDDVIIGLFQ